MNGTEEERAMIAYEFRRHLAVVLANSELLLEESMGPLTDDQREALEEVVATAGEVTALTAHAFETEDIEAVTQIDEESIEPMTETTSSLDDPEEFDPIVLTLDAGEFTDLVADQIERAGHDVRVVDDLHGLAESEAGPSSVESDRGEDRHVVFDCGFPTKRDLEQISTLTDETGSAGSVTLASTVEDQAIPSPFVGIAGIVSPAADEATVDELVNEQVVSDSTGVRVGFTGDADGPFAATLEDASYPVDHYPTTAELEVLEAGEIDVLFVEADMVGEIDDTALTRLRLPTDTIQIPIAIVGPSPTNDQWIPTCGNRLFARKPITAVDFAAEILLTISMGEEHD